jgi:AcrR family transcriptional regulator
MLESDDIIAVTLSMARKGGLTRLSMRQIAAELGVTATALYYHFRNKNDLLDRVTGHIMESIAVPDRRLPWTDRVRQLVLQQMQAALAYPGLARFLVHHRESLGALRWTETILEVLHDAGFRGASLKSALATLSFFVHPLTLADERPQAGPVVMIRHKLVAKRIKTERNKYPHLIEVLPELADYSYDQYMPVALDGVIAGLVAQLKPAARARSRRALNSR